MYLIVIWTGKFVFYQIISTLKVYYKIHVNSKFAKSTIEKLTILH